LFSLSVKRFNVSTSPRDMNFNHILQL
jgi:hypothetical protein